MEEWRIISDFPDYAVSDGGRVRRLASGKILKPHLGRYASLTLYRKRKPYFALVHRLVCSAFLGPAPTPRHQVAHSDGNGQHNHKDNLRWATSVENEADKSAHGTNLAGRSSWVPLERRPRGERHGRRTKPGATARGERIGTAKLTNEKIAAIRLDSRSRKKIATEYGITVTMVGYIQRGISWAHVPMPEIIGDSR